MSTHPLQAIADGAPCTWFLTPANPVTARKKWIAGSLEPRGALTIDAGAVKALRAGKSLLPAGVIKVEGTFERGDAVLVRGPDGAEIGRGLVAYDADDADKIKGRSSADILLDPRLRRPRRDDPPRRSGARRRLNPSSRGGRMSEAAWNGRNAARPIGSRDNLANCLPAPARVHSTHKPGSRGRNNPAPHPG